MDFPVAQLQAGQKAWHAGGDGGMVTFADLGCSAREVPKKEVLLLGKVLFGRQRFAFEVQVLDHTPAAVKKSLKKLARSKRRGLVPLTSPTLASASQRRQKADLYLGLMFGRLESSLPSTRSR